MLLIRVKIILNLFFLYFSNVNETNMKLSPEFKKAISELPNEEKDKLIFHLLLKKRLIRMNF